MEWFRAYHDLCFDAKWPMIARKAGVNSGTVVAVWMAALTHASQQEDRGSLDGFDPEMADVFFGYEDGTCQSVLDVMQAKGLIVDNRVANWDKRQPMREDGESARTSTERSREYRERQRNAAQRDATQCNAAQRDATQCNAPDPDTDTEEEEILNTPPHPPLAGGERAEGEIPAQPITPPERQPEVPQPTKAPDKRRRSPSGNTVPELRQAIADFTPSEHLRAALEGFRAMRERMRKPLTGRALELVFRELEKLAPNNPALQVEIVNQSVMRGWQGVFELKGPTRASPGMVMGDLAGRNMQTMAAVLAERQQRRAENGQI